MASGGHLVVSGQHRLCVQSPAAGAGKGLSEGTEMVSTGSCGRGHSITAPRVGAGMLVHPDREWVEFLLWGSRQGFQIGFSTESCSIEWMCTEHAVTMGTQGSGAGLPGQGGQGR